MSLPSATDLEPDRLELLPGWFPNPAPVPRPRVDASAYAAGTAARVAADGCLRCLPLQLAALASGSLEHLQPLAVGLVGAGFAFSGEVLDLVADGLVQKGLGGFRLTVDFICGAGNPRDAKEKKRRFFANALQMQKPEADRACVFESIEALRGSRSRCLCHFPGAFSEKSAAERALTERNSCRGAGRVNLLLASVPLAQLSPKTGEVDAALAAPTVASYVADTTPELVVLEDQDVAGDEGTETPGQLKAAELLKSAGYAVQKLLADPARWGVPVHRPRAYVIGCLAGEAGRGSLFHGAAARASRAFCAGFESALRWWEVEGPSVQEFAEVSSEINKADIAAFLLQESHRQTPKSPAGWEKPLAAYCQREGLRMPKIETCNSARAAEGPWQTLLPAKKKVLLYIAEKCWGANGRAFVADLAAAPGNGFGGDSGALPVLRKDSEVSWSSISPSAHVPPRACPMPSPGVCPPALWSFSLVGQGAGRQTPELCMLPLRCGSPLRAEDGKRRALPFESDSAPIRLRFDSDSASIRLRFESASILIRFRCTPTRYRFDSDSIPLRLGFDSADAIRFRFDSGPVPIRFCVAALCPGSRPLGPLEVLRLSGFPRVAAERDEASTEKSCDLSDVAASACPAPFLVPFLYALLFSAPWRGELERQAACVLGALLTRRARAAPA